jgi:cyclic pyranopterin phosphate synthase
MTKLQQAIIASMEIKPERHFFDINEQPVILRHMSNTGG